MPGRKDPEPSEEEKTRLYRLEQKRSHGDEVVGEAVVEDHGEVAQIEAEREDAA